METIIPGTLKGESRDEQIDAAALLADTSEADDGGSVFSNATTPISMRGSTR
nr:hypothetical protein [Marinicella sp. W31]MDC2875931.1 hypothetical protein [Marinicella sp. W31]